MLMKVVYDPEIPGEAARRLAEAAGRGRLVPFSAAQERWDAARQEPSTNRFTAGVGGAVFSTLFAVALSLPAAWAWRELRTDKRPALPLKYSRRYVVPEADLDPEAKQLWSRAARAAGTITSSEVARE